MSPTTLYREGTDLDDLLAELDTRYPGQVRVVEVTHPREGGVLGFFAKQRVGVHYRLAGTDAGSPGDGVIGAGTASGAGAASFAREIPGGRDGFAAGYDDVAPTRVRTGVPERIAAEALGFGPGTFGAAIRAGLQPEAGVSMSPAADILQPAAAPAPAMQFAQILADIALKKATSTSAPAMAPGVAAALSALRGEATARRADATAVPPARSRREADLASSAAGTTAVRAETHNAAADLAAGFATTQFEAIDAAEVRLASFADATVPGGESAHALCDGPTGADVGTAAPIAATGERVTGRQAGGQKTRRRPRAVPQFHAASALQTDVAPEGPAPTAAPDEAALPLPAAPRPGPLGWALTAPTATVGAAGALPAALPTLGSAAIHAAAPGAAEPRSTPTGTTALLERPATATPIDAPELPPAQPADTPSHSVVRPVGATRPATSLTLRRQLLELGIPVDRVPTDAVHSYAAVEQLVRGLAPAPELPAAPGQIVVLAGKTTDIVAAADGIVADMPGTFEAIWTVGCPATLGTRRINTNDHVIASADSARDIATTARAATDGPTLIVVAVDSRADDVASVIAAIEPDAVWVSVDATRKTSDTRRQLRAVPRTDALIVTGAAASGSPATVWELETPIAYVDGRPSSGPGWAVLLLGKLAELEESACSDALC